MPVRRIPKNHLSVTGNFASRKNGTMGSFESLLEKEYMLLLDFDDDVESFEEQPVNVPVHGVRRGYTPDILVRFRPSSVTGEVRRPFLTEVKHSDDLRRNAEKYAPKFAAAQQYASDRDWEFGLTTEKEIRTTRLNNIKFLREYRNIFPAEGECNQILNLVESFGGSASLQDLVDCLSTNKEDQLAWLPVTWHMVLTRRLFTDLNASITGNMILQLPRSIL